MMGASLLLFLAAAGADSPASPPPEQAAGSALMQCVAHATDHGKINAENAAGLLANGLVYTDTPPRFLASSQNTPYGMASYAQATSTNGQVWAVGYDKGACLVVAIGTPVEPIEKRLIAMFAIPNTWKAEPAAKPDAGERKLQFGWLLRPGFKLTALISLRDLAAPAMGMTMVTIAHVAEKKD